MNKVKLDFNQADEFIQIAVNKMNAMNIQWGNVSPVVKDYINMQRLIILRAYPAIKFDSRPTKKKGGLARKETKNKLTQELESLVKKNIDKSYFKNSVSAIIREAKRNELFNAYSDQKLRRAIEVLKK